jgi:hypothetical protein
MMTSNCVVCCSGRGRVAYEDLSEGEQLELQQLVLRYLHGECDQWPWVLLCMLQFQQAAAAFASKCLALLLSMC